jgi:hypothetical protein
VSSTPNPSEAVPESVTTGDGGEMLDPSSIIFDRPKLDMSLRESDDTLRERRSN